MIYRYRPPFFDAFRRALGRPLPYPHLSRWANQTLPLVRAVYAAADAGGLDEASRRALRLHVDKRDVSMETILTTIRYHAAHEYPYLLGEAVEHNVTAVYATNLNDRYLMLRLCEVEALASGELGARLAALRDHLDSVPSSVR